MTASVNQQVSFNFGTYLTDTVVGSVNMAIPISAYADDSGRPHIYYDPTRSGCPGILGTVGNKVHGYRRYDPDSDSVVWTEDNWTIRARCFYDYPIGFSIILEQSVDSVNWNEYDRFGDGLEQGVWVGLAFVDAGPLDLEDYLANPCEHQDAFIYTWSTNLTIIDDWSGNPPSQTVRILNENSTYGLELYPVISTDPPDFSVTNMGYGGFIGGIDFDVFLDTSSNVTTKVSLFWATGPSITNRLSNVAFYTNANITGDLCLPLQSIHVPGTYLTNSPPGATHVIVVVDTDNLITESSEDNNTAAIQVLSPTDLFAIDLTNNVLASAWLATYTIQGGPRLTNTIAGMFWSKGTNFSDRLSNTPFYSNNIATTFGGPDSFFIPFDYWTNAPPTATHLLLALDPRNLIVETIETNNVVALPFSIFGIDISKSAGEPSVNDFVKIKALGYQCVIVAGKQSVTINEHARDQLHNARLAGLLTATYCFLNFSSSSDGARQVRDTLRACGDEAAYVGFIAIDVERPESATNRLNAAEQAAAVLRINEAVNQVNAVGLRPIMYTRRDDWIYYTADTNLFSSLLLWNPRTKNNYDITLPDLSLPGETFGGWTNRSGKQYVISVPGSSYYLDDPHIEVDLDVFLPAIFAMSNPGYQPISFSAHITSIAGQLVISWSSPFVTLEEATSVNGPWTTSANQTSPVIVVPSGNGKFYRVR